jgi:LmbE family N-acetylglucosaminyl deacetylase
LPRRCGAPSRSRLFRGPDDPRIKRALCIVAHPDDIEFFCAGTVVRMARRGVAVDFVLATSGDKGARNGELNPEQVASTREAEQLRAAGVLGAQRVEFLRHRDAELIDSLEFRGELVAEIRRSRPDVLFSFDPTPGYRQHPDHRVVGRVALDAAWPCARDPLTYPDAGSPHETKEAWLFAGPRTDLEVDVTGELETKIEARLEHASQTRSGHVALRGRWRRIAGVERFAQIDLR